MGGMLGSFIPFPVIGNVIGWLGGAGAGMYAGRRANELFEPRVEQLATRLVGGDSEDLYYWMNKVEIDQLGQSFATTQVA